MTEKKKITIDEQIEHIKSKNIKFEIMSENDAKKFLTYNTYYFKLKSYAKSFERKKDGSFVNLDFAYLVELSTLDANLRLFIINLSLSTEHSLKTMLIRDVTNNEKENGITIINDLFEKYPFIKKNINQKKKDSACADLIQKYENQWSVWSIVEVLSFGDFIKLYQLYYLKYPTEISDKVLPLLWSAKFLRNAAAHNNCLLNSLRIPYKHTHLNQQGIIAPTKELQHEISKIENISKSTRKKLLRNPIIHDFVASLFLFNYICTSEPMKGHIYNDLEKLFKERFVFHKEYFEKDSYLISCYIFLEKVIDYVK